MSVVERNAGREMLDAEPLKRAIRRDAELALLDARTESLNANKGYYVLSERIGIPGDILTRILTQRHVGIDMADRYCCATNRLLRDLYPEVYEEDANPGFPAYCRSCRYDVDHDIIHEWHLRMHVRCRDCRTTRYIERNRRPIPQTAFKPRQVDDGAIVAAYLVGAPASEVARRFGFASDKPVLERVRAAGHEVRPNANAHTIAVGSRNLEHGRTLRRERGAETIRRLSELWLAGAKVSQIAAELGLSESHILTVRARCGLPKRLPGGRGWA